MVDFCEAIYRTTLEGRRYICSISTNLLNERKPMSCSAKGLHSFSLPPILLRTLLLLFKRTICSSKPHRHFLRRSTRNRKIIFYIESLSREEETRHEPHRGLYKRILSRGLGNSSMGSVMSNRRRVLQGRLNCFRRTCSLTIVVPCLQSVARKASSILISFPKTLS
jgi:hypothetical protein